MGADLGCGPWQVSSALGASADSSAAWRLKGGQRTAGDWLSSWHLPPSPTPATAQVGVSRRQGQRLHFSPKGTAFEMLCHCPNSPISSSGNPITAAVTLPHAQEQRGQAAPPGEGGPFHGSVTGQDPPPLCTGRGGRTEEPSPTPGTQPPGHAHPAAGCGSCHLHSRAPLQAGSPVGIGREEKEPWVRGSAGWSVVWHTRRCGFDPWLGGN